MISKNIWKNSCRILENVNFKAHTFEDRQIFCKTCGAVGKLRTFSKIGKIKRAIFPNNLKGLTIVFEKYEIFLSTLESRTSYKHHCISFENTKFFKG